MDAQQELHSTDTILASVNMEDEDPRTTGANNTNTDTIREREEIGTSTTLHTTTDNPTTHIVSHIFHYHAFRNKLPGYIEAAIQNHQTH